MKPKAAKPTFKDELFMWLKNNFILFKIFYFFIPNTDFNVKNKSN